MQPNLSFIIKFIQLHKYIKAHLLEVKSAPGYPHQVQWDHANPAASDLWANGCLAMVNSGFVDGCFMDGCTKDECGSGNPGTLLFKPFSGGLN